MGWFRKKPTPPSNRTRALQAEIEQIEAQIKLLAERAAQAPSPRSTSPVASPQPAQAPAASSARPSLPREQVFERVDHQRLSVPPEAANKALYNELGVRRYDLAGAWQRWLGHFRSQPNQHQTFVRLLAAGNIQGLRPLRYEKHVARRRFIVLALVFCAILYGVIYMFVHH